MIHIVLTMYTEETTALYLTNLFREVKPLEPEAK